jgi:hypothetical protein
VYSYRGINQTQSIVQKSAGKESRSERKSKSDPGREEIDGALKVERFKFKL